ncbi:hypothetical protein [Nonomuraea sp. NPDC003804]|uniref:hypothetical protein n=1 Tax=Nonomuraea sp. NPDC003804 TaxID=3154547 RepID=UPI0033B1C4C3
MGRSPEPGAQVRILQGAHSISQARHRLTWLFIYLFEFLGLPAVPELRATLAAHMLTPWAIDTQARALAGGRGSIVPQAPTPEAASRQLCEEEHERLKSAELFFVTTELSRLAVVAGESLPEFHLEPADVPSPTGFMVFGEPIGSYINRDLVVERYPIVAVSWGQCPPNPARRHGGLWMTFYTPTDINGMVEFSRRLAGRPLRTQELAHLRKQQAPLTWDNEAVMWYGSERVPMSFQPGASFDADLGSTAPWVQSVRATWLLMGQPAVAEPEDLHRSRASQRRDQRDGYSSGPVQLLRLRRASREHGALADDAGESRDYACRWMVRGHWRQQW